MGKNGRARGVGACLSCASVLSYATVISLWTGSLFRERVKEEYFQEYFQTPATPAKLILTVRGRRILEGWQTVRSLGRITLERWPPRAISRKSQVYKAKFLWNSAGEQNVGPWFIVLVYLLPRFTVKDTFVISGEMFQAAQYLCKRSFQLHVLCCEQLSALSFLLSLRGFIRWSSKRA